jgi:putative thioredoxin
MDVTDFQRDVIERSRTLPVVVDFWAAWCGPCRVLGPILERLEADAQGRWTLAKLDTEAHPDVAAEYAVMSIPNVKLFVDGEVVDEFLGAIPESEVRRWLAATLPSPHADAIVEARAQLARGAWADAAEALRAVVAAEPMNGEAALLLAEASLHLAPAEVAALVRPLESDPERADRAEAIGALARLILRAERPADFPEGPARERMLEGLAAARAGDWAAALAALIGVLERSRDYADGAAREAGRAIFVLLGHDHPIVERFHRGFSSALHA